MSNRRREQKGGLARGAAALVGLVLLGIATTAHAQLRVATYNTANSDYASQSPRSGMDVVLGAIGDEHQLPRLVVDEIAVGRRCP